MKEKIKNWLEANFRFVFAILFTPIRWLSNLLTRPKESLLEWRFCYGPFFVKIQTNHREQFLNADLLIASYIFFYLIISSSAMNAK